VSLGARLLNRHPDDATLVRHLDGEDSRDEQAPLATHLAACADCARRRRIMAERSRQLADLLGRTDVAPRAFPLRTHQIDRQIDRRVTRSGLSRWIAAAAATLLVLGAVALSASPVRAWILERWADVRRLLGVPEPTASTPAPRGAARDTASTVWFTPTADVLTIRVTTRQAAGSLLLEAIAGETASAVVRGASEDDELIVLPDELRITNTAASRATYRVALPAQLKRVVVIIGAEPPVSVAPVPGGPRTLDLSVPGPIRSNGGQTK